MTTHPHYRSAVTLLALLHDTLPCIIEAALRDTESAEGLEMQRKLILVLNFCKMMKGE